MYYICLLAFTDKNAYDVIINTYIYIYIYLFYICMYMYIYMYIYVNIFIYMYIYIYIIYLWTFIDKKAFLKTILAIS